MIARRLCALLAILLLSALSYLAFVHVQANSLVIPIQQQIQRWADGEEPSHAQWQQALTQIEQAVALTPGQAEYQLTQAKVIEWGWYKGYATTETVAKLPLLYQQAMDLRPQWAQAYADAAWYWFFIKAQPERAFGYLTLAYQRGPYLPEVLFRGVTIELQAWPSLSTVQKAAVLQRIKLLYRSDLHGRLLTLLQRNAKSKLACLYLRQQVEFSTEQRQQITSQLCEN